MARPRPPAPLRAASSCRARAWWGAHLRFEENPPCACTTIDDYLDDENHVRHPARSPTQTDASPTRARTFEGEFDPGSTRAGRLTEQERARLAAVRESALAGPQLPPGTDRWSTWGDGEQGPQPRPGWVVTELAAADTELGVLKTGKEADVHLIQRAVPDTDRGCLLAAKRYRSNEHRMFHRDAGYLEGRRMRRSREMRAMANRTAFGRNLIAEQWAVAEFAALSRLWSIGAPVPYPVQRSGTELLMEFLGDEDGTAAPRLAELRPDADELVELWRQLVAALDAAGERGPDPRRPVGVQPAGPRRAGDADRPAADRRRGGQPARAGVPGPRRGQRHGLVPRAGPARAGGRRRRS